MASVAAKNLKKFLKGCTNVVPHKFGSRHKGYEATLPSGDKAYVVERRHHQIYRDGLTSISEASLQHKASWMLEHTILRLIQKKECKWIIIFVLNTGEFYVSKADSWQDKTIVKDSDTRLDRVRHYPLHLMKKGQVDIAFDKLMK